MDVRRRLERSNKFNACSAAVRKVVEEAAAILGKLEIPLDNMTARQLERMAKVFLAVAGVKKPGTWSSALDRDTDTRAMYTREIIRYLNQHLGESISSGSYDDIRRKDLLLPVLAGIVVPTKPYSATNDPSRCYALDPGHAKLIRGFGQPGWDRAAAEFMEDRETLSEQLRPARNLDLLSVTIPGGRTLRFKPGKHNELQKAVIEGFLPRYGFGAEVLYVGDAAQKHLLNEEGRLLELGFTELAHGKLPDVVAFSPGRGWLYLIEAFHTSGPMTPERLAALRKLTAGCAYPVVYVTAFATVEDFRKQAAHIAWETEVWIAETPDHLVHFNGERFLGPHRAPAR